MVLCDHSRNTHVGPIVDGTPWATSPPSNVNFQDAMVWYSGHYHKYCMKMQVVVTPRTPVLAVAMGNIFPGSIGDIVPYKKILRQLDDYLRVQDDDELAKVDEHPAHYAILADKGYIGRVQAAHGKITPKKAPKTTVDKQRNKLLSTSRVVIEQFFGMRSKLWAITMCRYPFDDESRQIDFQTVILLTNEVVYERNLELTEEDRLFYHQFVDLLRSEREEKVEKHRISCRKSREKGKKRKICQKERNEVIRRRTEVSQSQQVEEDESESSAGEDVGESESEEEE